MAGLRTELKWLARTQNIIMRGLSPAHDLLVIITIKAGLSFRPILPHLLCKCFKSKKKNELLNGGAGGGGRENLT